MALPRGRRVDLALPAGSGARSEIVLTFALPSSSVLASSGPCRVSVLIMAGDSSGANATEVFVSFDAASLGACSTTCRILGIFVRRFFPPFLAPRRVPPGLTPKILVLTARHVRARKSLRRCGGGPGARARERRAGHAANANNAPPGCWRGAGMLRTGGGSRL